MLFHCKTQGPDEEAFKISLKKCIGLAQNISKKKVSIVVHTKSQFEEGIFSKILGEDFVKAVLKNPVSIGGVEIDIKTEKTIKSVLMNYPILACHISTEFLEKLISKYPNADIVYLPWQDDELESYLNNNTSTEIYPK